MNRFVSLLVLLPFAACSTVGTGVTTATTDVTSALDTAVVTLTAVDKALTIYAELPLCPKPVGTVCQVAATTAKLKAAAAKARLDIEAAQSATATAAQYATALAEVAAVVSSLSSL